MRRIYHLPFTIYHLRKFKQTIRYLLFPIRCSRGFTIVELLIYMGILSVMLVVLTEIFFAVLDVTLDSQSTSTMEQDSRFILSRLSYDITNASSITTPSAAGQTSNNLQIVSSSINYSYSLSNGNLQMVNNNETDVLSGYDSTISNLKFIRVGNPNGKNSITISFTIASKTKRQTVNKPKDFKTTIGIR